MNSQLFQTVATIYEYFLDFGPALKNIGQYTCQATQQKQHIRRRDKKSLDPLVTCCIDDRVCSIAILSVIGLSSARLIIFRQNRIFYIMKIAQDYRNPFQKLKQPVKPADRLPVFYNCSRIPQPSTLQSPYASLRRPHRAAPGAHNYQSVEDIRKSCPASPTYSLKKKREKENKGRSTKAGNYMSCTMTPNHYYTQANEEAGGVSRANYKFMYQIGFGGFGKVWKVQEKSTWNYFAMKQIKKRKVIEKDSVECIMNEKKVLSNLNHPFLVNIKHAFQDKQNLYLIMDYLKGADLRYHICYREHFTETETRFLMACLILALEQIHSRGIVHRDIKPENLVLEETGYLRLTDFGIAKFTKDLKLGKYDSSGTPGYMAPEVLLREDYDQSADFFALGVVGYELMLNKRPYFGKNRKEIKEQIMEEERLIASCELPSGWSRESMDFINKLLARKPAQRLGGKDGIRSLKQHPWMREINWKKLYKKELMPPFIPNIVCESKQYLDEIQSYNEMNQEENPSECTPITPAEDRLFEGYELQSRVLEPSSTVQTHTATPFRNSGNIAKNGAKGPTRSKKVINIC